MLEIWHLLEDAAGNAAWNMAVDEALLQCAATRRQPLLRVYTWDRPSVSIGYFQKYPAQLAVTHAIVRRPTGGGLVYHGEDTTITVIAPPGHALHKLSTNEAYCAVHNAIIAAFATPVVLHTAPLASPRGQYECFQKPVQGDVMADGRKLAGGAQRRNKHGLLHQGSIAVRLPVEELVAGFEKTFPARFARSGLTDAERALAEQLAREKYVTVAWNERVR